MDPSKIRRKIIAIGINIIKSGEINNNKLVKRIYVKYKDSLIVKLEYGWVLRELVTPFRHVDNGDEKFYLSFIYNW